MTAPSTHAASESVRLGLRGTLGQFALLVVVSALVGAMVGLEPGILPASAVLLGIGTAMVYPTLLAAIGAVLAGDTADVFGSAAAMWGIAALTFVSGAVSTTRMAETLPPGLRTTSRAESHSGTPMPGSQSHLAIDTHRPE